MDLIHSRNISGAGGLRQSAGWCRRKRMSDEAVAVANGDSPISAQSLVGACIGACSVAIRTEVSANAHEDAGRTSFKAGLTLKALRN